MNNLIVGKNIRKMRLLKGLSQAQLAEKIGVTWEMISRYERGLSSPHKKINAIASALGVSVSQLFQKNFESSLSLNDSSRENYGVGLAVVPEIDLDGVNLKNFRQVDDFETFVSSFGVVSTIVLGKNLLNNRKNVFCYRLSGSIGIFIWGENPDSIISEFPRYLQITRRGVKLIKDSDTSKEDGVIIGTLIGLFS